MPKPRSGTGEKNLISQNLILLRKQYGISQRDLAYQLQLLGFDMDKNVITRIETNQRFVTDIEVQALCRVFGVDYRTLIDGEGLEESESAVL
ncbi:MAG: helix-turn-helix domain-containing protein [Lachnospiraceae bacterium]|nr:helix-turn-helix domain-containing protein [Lachnospiraceae bacterium]